jgi:hypothetical protein
MLSCTSFLQDVHGLHHFVRESLGIKAEEEDVRVRKWSHGFFYVFCTMKER